MSCDPAISVDHVTKDYVVSQDPTDGGRRTRSRFGRRPSVGRLRRIRALDDVTFTVKQGEVVGVVGRNGAGKSTLLRVVSRITRPDSGRVIVVGRVGSILEVGAGFHPDLTGAENVFLSGAVLGMGRRQVASRFEEIAEFAELTEFMNVPVKKYSTGMQMRLAFSVSAHLDAEVLLIDEALAVGDVGFQAKSIAKIRELAGTKSRTVLLVSHSMVSILELCDRVIALEEGRLVEQGDPLAVADRFLAGFDRTIGTRDDAGCWDLSQADQSGVLKAATLLDGQGRPTNEVDPFGAASLILETCGLAKLQAGTMLVTVLTEQGIPIATANTMWWEKRWQRALSHQSAEERFDCEDLILQLPWFSFTPGRYLLEIEVLDGAAVVGRARLSTPITVTGTGLSETLERILYRSGRTVLPCEWEIRSSNGPPISQELGQHAPGHPPHS